MYKLVFTKPKAMLMQVFGTDIWNIIEVTIIQTSKALGDVESTNNKSYDSFVLCPFIYYSWLQQNRLHLCELLKT